MLIRRNNTLSRRASQATANDLLPLRETPSVLSEEGPLVLLPSLTLNPESPITSALVSDKPSHPLFKADREESEFSFKQGGLLTEEDPQQLETNIIPPQQKPAFAINQLRKSAVATQKDPPEEARPSKGRKVIGTITNPRQGFADSRPQSSEGADRGVRKPLSNSLGSSRLEEVLNKIKSLRMGGDAGGNPSLRYSTMRHDESKVESTDASGEEPSPIKSQVISSIRKHVERMNHSLAKDHRIKQEESDSQEPSLLFKPQEGANKPIPQDLLQSKNKSFLVRSTNKKSKREAEIVQISYKTSILQLKELSGRFDESMRVKIAVPVSFSAPIFQPNDNQEDLFDKAVGVLRELGAACLHPMTIRKYSNCVLVMVDDLGLLSYFSGHVYFGGWQQEGKSGVGLELVPGRFVYYGEFRSNRREGYGVLKDWQGSAILGEWREGRLVDGPSPPKFRSF